MKLIFSPYFDNGVYLSRECILGEKAVGPMGLLAELELRTGTVGHTLSTGERTALYMNAIKDAGVKGRFFEDSFIIDELGVSSVLLQWRDMLILAGWKGDIQGISKKLDDFADIEQKFKSPGIADRWRILLEVLKNPSVTLPEDFEIEVHMAKNLLEPIFQEILAEIEKKGHKINFIVEDKDAIEKAVKSQKVNILKFHDVYANYEWAALNAEKYDLIIADTPMILNSYLHGSDKPVVDACSSDSNPSVIQIFKLGMSLFDRPLNIYNLLSYLTLPVHPMSSILRRKLSNILLEEGGLGESWTKAIDEFKYLKKKEKESDEDEADDKKTLAKRIFIDMVDPRNEHPAKISKLEVQNYCTALRLWANAYSMTENLDSALLPQLESLKSFCSTLDIVLQNSSDEIEPSTFNSWIRFIYSPCDHTIEIAEKDSIDTISDIRQLGESANNILWVNCTGINPPHYGYDFLNESEKETLARKGVRILDKETLSLSDQYAVNLGIGQVINKIDICTPVFGAEGLTEENPVVTAIRQTAEKNNITTISTDIQLDNQTLTEKNCVPLDGKKEVYNISGIDTNALKREYESHSSLNQLIQFPFEYTLERYAKLKDRSIEEIGQISTVEGNVAHKYVETLFEKAKGDVDQFINLHQTDYDSLLDTIAEEQGAVLLLPENHFEFNKYKRILNESIVNLGKIIKNNHLFYVGCEVLYQPSHPILAALQAKIDLMLKDSEEHIYIIDLKWTRSKNRYYKLLHESKEQQLAIYKKAVELEKPGTIVAAYGYFVLSQGRLFIPEEYGMVFNNHDLITTVKREDSNMTAASIFERVVRSYKYRMNSMENGEIEEGEKMPLEHLKYVQDTMSEELVPLDSDWEEKTLKSTAFGNPNRILKEDLR